MVPMHNLVSSSSPPCRVDTLIIPLLQKRMHSSQSEARNCSTLKHQGITVILHQHFLSDGYIRRSQPRLHLMTMIVLRFYGSARLWATRWFRSILTQFCVLEHAQPNECMNKCWVMMWDILLRVFSSFCSRPHQYSLPMLWTRCLCPLPTPSPTVLPQIPMLKLYLPMWWHAFEGGAFRR